MLSYAIKIIKKKIKKNQKWQLKTKKSIIFEMMIIILLAERKKNGAHNHLITTQETQTSKYSRHVVLCKNDKDTPNTEQKQSD